MYTMDTLVRYFLIFYSIFHTHLRILTNSKLAWKVFFLISHLMSKSLILFGVGGGGGVGE